MTTELELQVEELDHPVDNAPVRSLSVGGLTVEGYSRAAVQTYWRIPELKLGFDLGGQPWSFMTTPNWFISHTHLDHIAALPILVARRRMMKMAEPTIYLPAQAVDAVEQLLLAFRRLDRGRMPARLVGLVPGQEINLSRELVARAFATSHTIPSLGFIVWERRRKLKPEYRALSNDQIRDLRLAGTEVSAEVRMPLVAYTGDTAPAGLDAYPEIYKAKILITELTFVGAGERPSVIHKFGHMHLDDLIARADRFENELIVASHFSTRLHPDQIQRIVDRALPDALKGRLRVWL